MGQVFKKYWTTVSKKPKGFKSLGSNIYEYEVIFKVPTAGIMTVGEYDCYREMIPSQYYYVDDYGSRNIDQDKFKLSVKKLTGVRLENLSLEMFRRDGIHVPFVEVVDVPVNQVEKYLQFRELRDRVIKINQIKNKIC